MRPAGFDGERAACTAIYYLLERPELSALHRIRSEEVWHLYAGGPLTLHVFSATGQYETIPLATDLTAGRPQAVVPARAWFGATVDDSADYALAGCTVAPGFEFRDFELANRAEALKRFPEHSQIVGRLCIADAGGH